MSIISIFVHILSKMSNFVHNVQFCPQIVKNVQFCPYWSSLSIISIFVHILSNFVQFCSYCPILSKCLKSLKTKIKFSNFSQVGPTLHLHWCQKAPRFLGHGQRGWRSKQGQQIDLQIRRRRIRYTKSLRRLLLPFYLFSVVVWTMAFWKPTLEHIPNAGYN